MSRCGSAVDVGLLVGCSKDVWAVVDNWVYVVMDAKVAESCRASGSSCTFDVDRVSFLMPLFKPDVDKDERFDKSEREGEARCCNDAVARLDSEDDAFDVSVEELDTFGRKDEGDALWSPPNPTVEDNPFPELSGDPDVDNVDVVVEDVEDPGIVLLMDAEELARLTKDRRGGAP